ncbi:hypothetical protein FDX19_20880 [Citrobacter sp. wls619]|uniref:hypothetical protein n=1 Tax=Citrobacter sp. wls619 TaxID=2576432 RepID=UPI0010CA0CC3|nr:hypothetical protein [Citrobacter sp. wls619]TKV06429.1 hypothetical protein FDX19_20880 [Citrobacter sp. wls619]
MTQMVFRHGDTKKWKGVGYDFEIISEDDLQEYLNAGWFAHPDDLLNDSAEPEPEQEVKERKKPGPKPKG